MRVPYLLGAAVLLAHGVLLMGLLRTAAPSPAEVTLADMVARFEMAPLQPTHSPATSPEPDQAVAPSERPHAPRPEASAQAQQSVQQPAPQPLQQSADPRHVAPALPQAGAVTESATTPSHQAAATGEARPTPQVAPTAPSSPRTVAITAVQYQRPPAPVYPRRSERLGESGEVWLKVLISAQGRPAQVLVVRSSGFEALDRAAVEAMQAAVFKPYAENGWAQAVWVQTPIAFHLDSSHEY